MQPSPPRKGKEKHKLGQKWHKFGQFAKCVLFRVYMCTFLVGFARIERWPLHLMEMILVRNTWNASEHVVSVAVTSMYSRLVHGWVGGGGPY